MRRAGPGWVRGRWGGACHCRPQRHGSWLCRLLWSTASLRGASFLSADRPAAPGHACALQSLADARPPSAGCVAARAGGTANDTLSTLTLELNEDRRLFSLRDVNYSAVSSAYAPSPFVIRVFAQRL